MTKQIVGNNRFCGPAAIAAIAGISTDEAERLILEVRKEYNSNLSSHHVIGAYLWELKRSLERLGYKTNDVANCAGGSIFSLMHSLNLPGVYIFLIPGHFVTIEIEAEGKRYLIDNHTKKPLNLAASARLGQRVKAVVRVTK